jgi:polyhydroxybutyrate depolymerase
MRTVARQHLNQERSAGRMAWHAASLGVCAMLIAAAAQAGEAGSLRERLRERVVERAGARMAAEAPPAILLEATGRIARAGRYEIRLRHGGLERMALIHVPRSWKPGQPTPLVMALHGGGGGALYQADDANYGLISKAESAGFIAVFPNGISPARSGMLATWNAGGCCARARDQNIDDVGFLRAVLRDVQQRIEVDVRRVHAIGMSNGAMMAYRLACEASDVFSGIMAVAGTDNTGRCNPGRPVPVLHIHALDDDRVLFNGGAGKAFRDEALVTDFVSVPDTISRWVRLNHAGTTPRRVLSVTGAWCDLHEAGADGAPVQLCVTSSGGHSWPGGGKRRGEAPSNAIHANDVMWEFFSGLRR